MNRLITILLLAAGINHVYGLTYDEAEMYADFGVAMTGAEATIKQKPEQDDLAGGDTTEEDTANNVYEVPFENTDQYQWTAISGSGLGGNPEKKIMEDLLTALNNDTTKLPGWHVTTKASVTVSDSHSIHVGQTGLKEIVVMCTLLPIDAVAINLHYSTQNSGLSHSVWMYNTNTKEITELGHEQNSVSGEFSATYALQNGVNLDSDESYLFVLWDANQGQGYLDINGVDLSFTPDSEDPDYNDFIENNTPVIPGAPSIPEPTTATLSLLALAGLAARRRRK